MVDQVSKKQFGQVSRYAKEACHEAEGIISASSIDLESLQVNITKLTKFQSRIIEISDKLLPTIPDEELDAEIEKHEKLKRDLIEIIARTEIKLAASTRQEDEVGTAASSLSSQAVQAVDQFSSVRLPELEIPLFYGDALHFREFWDIFEAMVDKNPRMAEVTKLSHLLSRLRKEAKRLVSGYATTDANYQTVKDILKQRYNNQELIIHCHLDALISLPPCSANVGDLQHTFDDCERHIRSLVNLGLAEDTFGRVFVHILMNKLPIGVRIGLLKKKEPGECWSLSELRKFLEHEIYARDMGQRNFGASHHKSSTAGSIAKPNDSHGYPKRENRFRPPTASALTSSSGNNKASNVAVSSLKRCQFCSQNHFSNQCSKYPDVDSRIKVLGNGCFICLNPGHLATNCRSKKQCFYCKDVRHNSSLCRKQFQSSPRRNGNDKSTVMEVGIRGTKPEEQDGKKVTASLMSQGKTGVLQTALAEVVGPKGRVNARLLLDNGADNAFVTDKIVKQIGANCNGADLISLAGFADSKRKSVKYPIYDIKLKLLDGRFMNISAYGTPNITCPIYKHRLDVHKNPVLTKLPLADILVDQTEEVAIDILIGSDYYYEIVKAERIPLADGLFLLDSNLGYIVAGRIESPSSSSTQMLLTRSQFPESNFELERLWKLEEVGIKDPPEATDDEIALKYFNDSVVFDKDDKRYQVKWPLKHEMPDLPSNFKLAYARLKSMLHRLHSQPEVLDKYHNTLVEQESNGIIEVAPEKPDAETMHYIPHHGVLTPDKSTTKLRIVYDASSKINKLTPSLNDCMYRGPIMLQDLCGLLVRFRLTPTALVSDVEKAFLQIGLQPPDRELVRFLWVKDPSQPVSNTNIVHYRFCRVCFGVVASPFLLAATVTHHLQQAQSDLGSKILDNIYVDNVVGGVEGTTSAIKYYKEAKELFHTASMNLREWYSNDSPFMASVPENDRGQGEKTKVLGLSWHLATDTISIPKSDIGDKSGRPLTKRLILKAIAQLFDPCGFFAPVTIKGKMIIQELWQSKLGWDDPVPAETASAFQQFVADCLAISKYKLPRYISVPFGLESACVEIHCFCDASAKAYSAAVFLRISINDQVVSNLVFGKSRVSPLKTQTIPRLELIAVVIGTKLTEFIEREIKIPVQRKVIWTDSQCTLHWILGKPVSTTFVKNRVAKIKSSQNVQFRYVPTKENPADLPSRGTSYQQLEGCSLWWHGPTWLKEKSEFWPAMPTLKTSLEDDVSEPLDKLSSLVTTSSVDRQLINVSRFSSLQKVVNTTAYVLRFINKLKHQSDQETNSLTPGELSTAETLLLHEAQMRHFTENDKCSSRSRSNIFYQLGVQKDASNIFRCTSRLEHSDLPVGAVCPILLPRKDPLAKLIVESLHRKLHHAGVKHTLAELRYKYWLPQGRSEIKSILSECLQCQRQKGKPFQCPPEPPLPAFRVKGRRAFSTVGTDYVGPLIINSNSCVSQKVWLCLFTCALSRAVHLEVVTSMTADCFLLAFRRFVASCGCPEIVVSDNAKQLITAKATIDKLWEEAVRSPLVQEFSGSRKVVWKFIVELAPWMGGFYERMVGIVKNNLKAAIDRRRLNLAELQTVIAEVTSIVNSRPLVYCEDEVGDQPITPAHLTFKHHSLVPFVPGDDDTCYVDKPESSDYLIATWKRIQNIVTRFWESWNKQYLTSLRERIHAINQRNKSKLAIEVGMAVLISEKLIPRGSWRVGRVVELIKSNDNKIRSAVVKLSTGKSLNRSISQLYPLETQNGAPSDNGRRLANNEQEPFDSLLTPDGKQNSLGASVGESPGSPRTPEIGPKCSRQSCRMAAKNARAINQVIAGDESD